MKIDPLETLLYIFGFWLLSVVISKKLGSISEITVIQHQKCGVRAIQIIIKTSIRRAPSYYFLQPGENSTHSAKLDAIISQ